MRNQLIAETMYKSEDIEKWASGIKRIYDECKAAGVKVEFKQVKTGFVVSFKRPNWEKGEGLQQKGQPEIVVTKGSQKSYQKGSQKSSQKIWDLIQANPEITIEDLAKGLSISDTAVKKHITNLKAKGRLRRIGSDKGGYWEVVV